MVNISQVTKKILEEKPFIHESLEKGLVNIGALADYIKPQIEKELKIKVKSSAISMAIRRYLDKKNKFLKQVNLLKKTDLFLKSNLFEISVLKTPSLYSKLMKFYDVVDFKLGDTLNIIEGNFEVLIISNQKYLSKFLKILKSEKLLNKKKDLSAVSIRIPSDCLGVPGFYFAVTKMLLLENIPIVDVVSTHTEATFIFDDVNIVKAYAVLKEGILVKYYE
jgi:hypothetical protein